MQKHADKFILLTGFEPWNGEKYNPTMDVVEKLAGSVLSGCKVLGYVLPVSYRRVKDTLPALILEKKPLVALHLGLAPGSPVISVEKVALNIMATGPDSDGYKPSGEPIYSDGPVAYFSTIPVDMIVESLRRNGIPARKSFFAGTFLCNYALYISMHTVEMHGLETLVGFMHIPYTPKQAAKKASPTPSMCLHLMVEAVKIALETALRYVGENSNQVKK